MRAKAKTAAPKPKAAPALEAVVRRAAAEPAAEPEPSIAPVVALYDLVCPDEGQIEGGLEFAVCMTRARQHNRENPNHRADCFQQDPEG